MTIIRCVHHLGNPDGVEDVRQDGFFRLTGEADLGILGQTLALSMGYGQGQIPMSPKCLHGGSFEVRSALGFEGMETSWRHQSASSLNNECFFAAQDAQSCETREAHFYSGG